MRARQTLVVFACVLVVWTGRAVAQPDIRPLEVGRSIERVIGPGETQSYSLSVLDGQLVHVVIHQRGVDIVTTLVASDGTSTVAVNAPQSTQETEWITLVATASRDYRLDVRPSDRNAPPGRYAIAIAERRNSAVADEPRQSAQAAFSAGTRLFHERRYADALASYQDALAQYRQSQRRVEEAVTLNCLARTAVAMADYASALPRFDAALTIYRDLGDLDGQGATEHDIGSAHFNSGRSDEARSHFERALDARRQTGYRVGEGMTLRAIGSSYSAAGQQEKALEFYEQALTISRSEKFRAEEARTLSNLGIANSLLGRPERAIDYFEAALALSRELKDRATEAQALNNLGVAYRNVSRFEDAIRYYEQMLPIARELGDRAGEGRTLNNIGHANLTLSRYAAALDFFERSLVIVREVQNRNVEAFALSNIGQTYFWLGAYDKSIDFSEQALAIFREIKNRTEEGRVLNNLGDANDVLGRHEEAIAYYQQALDIARSLDSPATEARALGSLSVAYKAVGRYDEAIGVNQQALALFRAIKNRADEASTLVSLGQVYAALRRYDAAIQYYLLALPITRAVKDRTGEGLVLGDLMQAWKQQDVASVAVMYGKQAVNAFQEVRSTLETLTRAFQDSYLKSHEDTYRTLAELLISLGRLAEAEKTLELLKDEEFNRAARRSGPDTSSIGLTSAETDATTINDELAALAIERGPLLAKIADNTATDRDRQRLDVIEQAISDANRRLKATLADIARAGGDLLVTQQSQSMMQTLRRLGGGVVALYTVVANGSGWVILTTPDFRRAYPIRSADLNQLISDFRRALSNDLRDPVPLARALYDALFLQKNREGATLAADLRGYGASTLMWSLDGVLRYVPIAALHDGKGYLAARYTNVVFTTASLTRLLDPAQARWRAFGLGVSKQHGNFPALPGVPRELHSIIRGARAAPPQGVLPGVIRLDEQFTRQTMIDGLREGYPLVHIASHFSFNAAKEELSFLLLGDGSSLSVEDMQNSPGIFERVELLTLSACDTATTAANGKEVEGFAFVAQDLGAKAVVASLWPVADIGTEVLMREFYRWRQANPRRSKAEALRQAQMALLKREGLTHPHYWAAFILIGNWK
jgi:CHAT domain-containing protein/Flp pilus assembly protein TadD